MLLAVAAGAKALAVAVVPDPEGAAMPTKRLAMQIVPV